MFSSVEVHFSDDACAGPSIVLYGVEEGSGQLQLLQTILVGPFPDWEIVSRRVLREVMLACKPQFR